MFLFTLASKLGMTASDLMDNMSSTEFTEWRAYFEVVQHERERQQRLRDKGMF